MENDAERSQARSCQFQCISKFGETQFVQDIEQKWNLGINQGP